MSFSGEVKKELAKRMNPARHCQIAELAALMNFCGAYGRSGGESGGKAGYTLGFQTENEAVARKGFTLLKKTYNIDTDRILDEEELQGLFTKLGSPEEPVSPLQEAIRSFEIESKIILRKKYHVVYLKEGSGIVNLLNVCEAPVSLMNLENMRILKEMRGAVNRRVNCEAANIAKTVTAAARQVEDIEFLRIHYGFQNLPEPLRRMAEIRLEYPDAPLKELGERFDPPLGKSGVNHRLRRLSELAEKARL